MSQEILTQETIAQERLFRLLVGFILIVGMAVSIHYRRRANQAGSTISRLRDGRRFVFLSLTISSWYMALFTALTFVVIADRTVKEEATLLQRFGDEYRRYMERTPRYLPGLS